MHSGYRPLTIAIFVALLLPSSGTLIAQDGPREQEFVVTAYYSPQPDQCCYVKGSFEADKILNGQGTHAADGTPVYAGMVAAPSTYAFGTRIELPGLGVFTVHDRGGAINEWDTAHRIDIWMGSGEEGLARALAFGIRRIQGSVYPIGTGVPHNAFSIESIPAPLNVLRAYTPEGMMLPDAYPALGDKGLMVRLLQERLTKAGYFDHAVTGFFGPTTQTALASLIANTGISAPDDRLTSLTSAYLEAAIQVANRTAPIPVPFVNASSNQQDIAQAQRLLRSLGYYRGRTNGQYSAMLRSAILAYQQARQLVAGDTSPGAGQIGPLTKKHLEDAWKQRRIIALANDILDKERIRTILSDRGLTINGFLSVGSTGDAVERAQKLLASRGYFPAEEINGVFGELTQASVLRYQLDRSIVGSKEDTGAGMMGPQTIESLTAEQVQDAYRTVLTRGWDLL